MLFNLSKKQPGQFCTSGIYRPSIIFFLLIFCCLAFAGAQTNALKINKQLLPQEIDYDDKPELEYTYNNKIIALDHWDENREGYFIRMKFYDKEVLLKKQTNKTTKTKRVFYNKDFTVTFFEIVYGACAGEGAQEISGKLLIQTKSEQNTVGFKGSDSFYSSKKCQEMGNGG